MRPIRAKEKVHCIYMLRDTLDEHNRYYLSISILILHACCIMMRTKHNRKISFNIYMNMFVYYVFFMKEARIGY